MIYVYIVHVCILVLLNRLLAAACHQLRNPVEIVIRDTGLALVCDHDEVYVGTGKNIWSAETGCHFRHFR